MCIKGEKTCVCVCVMTNLVGVYGIHDSTRQRRRYIRGQQIVSKLHLSRGGLGEPGVRVGAHLRDGHDMTCTLEKSETCHVLLQNARYWVSQTVRE